MFGRKRTAQAPAVQPQWAYVAIAPCVPQPPERHAQLAGTAGWSQMPILSAQQQIGLYDGSPLNQYPAYLPGVQLYQGREGNISAWHTPAVAPTPNGSAQVTQHPTNLPGAQRYGSIFSGPLGPLDARKMQVQVLASQVRQSGLAAMTWARQLTPGQDGM